jgi:hypothetical protein
MVSEKETMQLELQRRLNTEDLLGPVLRLKSSVYVAPADDKIQKDVIVYRHPDCKCKTPDDLKEYPLKLDRNRMTVDTDLTLYSVDDEFITNLEGPKDVFLLYLVVTNDEYALVCNLYVYCFAKNLIDLSAIRSVYNFIIPSVGVR